MDDTPRHFFQELKSSVLKRRIGQIALAVVLAEATIRFLNSLIWFLAVPAIASVLDGHTESVLFRTKTPFPVEQLTGSVLEFGVAIIFVFYVNRWLMKPVGGGVGPEDESAREINGDVEDADHDHERKEVICNLVGEAVDAKDEPSTSHH